MPRPRIDDAAIDHVLEVYDESHGRLTAEQVTKETERKLGSRTPSLRKVQEILKEHRDIFRIIESEPELSPLGPGWPTDSEVVHYLLELGCRWIRGVQPMWTQCFIDTALELKGVLGSPTEWDNRRSWELPSPYGENAMVAGELAIIAEISNRRIISKALGRPLPYEDLYEILLMKPWNASNWASPNYSRVMVDGMNGIVPNDIYRSAREVERKIWAAIAPLRHWEYEFYGGNPIDPEDDRTRLEKLELEKLEHINEMEAEAASAMKKFLENLDELPEGRYVRRYEASLLGLWGYYRWDVEGRPGEPTYSREEVETSFETRSKSEPDKWVYRSVAAVDEPPF